VPAKRVRALDAVLSTSDLEDALALMRRHGSHLARSVDPDGRTTGILFLEDVLEVLVGDIRDESDRAR
jgi:CBS domain containing-hemolysin-like protein